MIEFGEALKTVLGNAPLLEVCEVGVVDCAGFVAAEDYISAVQCPPVAVSMRDGFAVMSSDSKNASKDNPVELKIAGRSWAGGAAGKLKRGECIRILTGAQVPEGADSIVPDEQCEADEKYVRVNSSVELRRHIQTAGDDFRKNDTLWIKGELLTPAAAGLLCAGGLAALRVYRKPEVFVLSVGDELVGPGGVSSETRRFASNGVALGSWFSSFGIGSETRIAKDDSGDICSMIEKALESADAVVTTGGTGGSERDFTIDALDSMGWEMKFRGVRMVPGKGTAFGLLDGRPVFCLSGGPTASEIAFLTIALPGILAMAGRRGRIFPSACAVLESDIRIKHLGWQKFLYGLHTCDGEGALTARMLTSRSRMIAMAQASCLISIPADMHSAKAGSMVDIRMTRFT